MNDEKEPGGEPATAASNTSETIEVLREKTAGAWVMPEPVFKQTSGYLPQGFEKRFPLHDPQADVPTEEPVEAPPPPDAPPAAAAPATSVQPQPDLVEDLIEVDAPPPAIAAGKKRSPVVRVVLALLGIAAMVVLGIIFLIVIWYLFFYHPSEPQIFN